MNVGKARIGANHNVSMNGAKLPADQRVRVERMVTELGDRPTAKALKTSLAVIDRICGSGVLKPDTLARITAALAELSEVA